MAQASSTRKAASDALASVIASLIALWSFYPIDVWKTRVQAGSNHGTKNHQLSSYLAGVEWKSLHTACSSFCYYFLYSFIIAWWQRRLRRHRTDHGSPPPTMSTPTRLLLAAVAAMANTFITLPLDVIAAQRQTRVKEAENDDQGYRRSHRGTPATEQASTTEDSLVFSSFQSVQQKCSPYWKGLSPSLLLCSNPAIHQTCFDSLKSRILLHRNTSGQSLSMPEAFVLGLVAKFVATISTYPLIRAKVMLMVTSRPPKKARAPTPTRDDDDQAQPPATTMMACLHQEFQRNGVSGLYNGLQLQLLHTLLKSALLMMLRERIMRTTHRMLQIPANNRTQA